MFRLEAYGTSISFETNKSTFAEASKELDDLCKKIGLYISDDGEWSLVNDDGEDVQA